MTAQTQPAATDEECCVCKGAGRLLAIGARFGMDMVTDCYNCRGTGRVPFPMCSICRMRHPNDDRHACE